MFSSIFSPKTVKKKKKRIEPLSASDEIRSSTTRGFHGHVEVKLMKQKKILFPWVQSRLIRYEFQVRPSETVGRLRSVFLPWAVKLCSVPGWADGSITRTDAAHPAHIQTLYFCIQGNIPKVPDRTKRVRETRLHVNIYT